ncbi:hypothetical protein B0O99DRAFT_606882 [Bisporella sp. PMI_857]|nr:hypothetical protein B0O99DRAFT_606882 [Bisporella sp. PMI_857]
MEERDEIVGSELGFGAVDTSEPIWQNSNFCTIPALPRRSWSEVVGTELCLQFIEGSPACCLEPWR